MHTEENRIEIRMLGGFSVSVNGRYLELGQNSKANFLKLIQVVLLRYEQGIAKRELIDAVFGYKELLDENNSLNNLLHQARRQLRKSGMPGSKYIVGRKGIYYPERPEGYCIMMDYLQFRQLCQSAAASEDSAEREKRYAEAFALYRGELLPDFATSNWVIAESIRLKSLYDETVNALAESFKEQQDYERLYRLYSRAALVYPDSGWQVDAIDALVLGRQCSKAYALYNETAHYYLDELEMPLPERLIQCYDRIHEDMKAASDDIEQIQTGILERDAALKSLSEETKQLGAYYCSYAGFIDVYNVLRRNLIRRGSSVFMMLCSLVDYEGKPIQSQEKLKSRADMLQKALQAELRQGDVFTKYSASQFLLLLIGARKEDCGLIYYRIARKLKELAGPRAELHYRIVSIAEIPSVLGKKATV